MNKIISILSIFFISASILAQSPDLFSYQAVIRDNNDQLIVNTQIGVRVSIQKFMIGMPPSYINLYIETHTPTTNDNGLINLQVGNGTLVSGDFSNIDWANGVYYLKTEIDPIGGTNYTITGSSRLLSVPYALHAKNVKTYKVGDYAFGGIVFWVDESGQHGLVCVKTDMSYPAKWNAGSYTYTMAWGNGILSGEMNTALIVSNQGRGDGTSYAALTCSSFNYVENGNSYGGWFLPSRLELNEMFSKKSTIDATALANGGAAFTNDVYWSSTESSNDKAWTVNMGSGGISESSKAYSHKVRAIKKF